MIRSILDNLNKKAGGGKGRERNPDRESDPSLNEAGYLKDFRSRPQSGNGFNKNNFLGEKLEFFR